MTINFTDVMTQTGCWGFAILTGIGTFLCVCRRKWRPWIYIDTILHKMVHAIQQRSFYHKAIEESHWQASAHGRKFIMRWIVRGFVCVAIFPFGDCNPYIASFRDYLIKYTHLPGGAGQSFEYWEAAVIVWSALFFISVQYQDGRHAANSFVHDPATAFDRAIVLVFYVVVGLFFYVYLLTSASPIFRVLGEMGLVALFCIQDILFMKAYSKERVRESDEKKQERLEKDADNYLEFLLLVDIPGICAFGVILAYLSHRRMMEPSHHWDASFASGAAALNLLLINIVYCSLSIWQKYVDVKPPNQSPTAGGPSV